jgi:Uma2 family endonuclease
MGRLGGRRAAMLVHASLPRLRRGWHHMAMPAPAPHTDWTVDMLDALPDDGQRYEIIDGVLYVTPSPNEPHQDVVDLLLAVEVVSLSSEHTDYQDKRTTYLTSDVGEYWVVNVEARNVSRWG